MLNNINSLNPVSNSGPSASIINQALHLIAGFGSPDGKSELKTKLEEMLVVQKHNEEIVEHIKEKHGDLVNKSRVFVSRVKAFDEHETAEKSSIAAKVDAYNRNLALFITAKSESDVWVKSKTEAFEVIAKNQVEKEKDLADREDVAQKKLEGHKRFDEGLVAREFRLGEGVSKLNSTISGLKKFLEDL